MFNNIYHITGSLSLCEKETTSNANSIVRDPKTNVSGVVNQNILAALPAERIQNNKESKRRQFINLNKEKKAVILDDVITSGESLEKTKDLLENIGFKVEHFVVFLDREQGGKEKLEGKGYNIKSKFRISKL